MKTRHSSIVICAEREETRDIDAAFLRTVSRFELVGDFQRQDGVFERVTLDNLAPNEICLDGEWTFDVVEQGELTRKLLAL